jgi:hypothetical protein
MTLDDLQQQWLAQDKRIDELVQFTRHLRLERALVKPRRSLRLSQFGDVFEGLLGLMFLPWTGQFLFTHLGEPRFWLPAAALHAWFVAVVAVAVARFVLKSQVHYDAPVLQIQQQLTRLRVLTLRALRLTFATGVIVWGAPIAIVAARSWFGLDLYALLGFKAVLDVLAVSAILALGFLAICALCENRLQHSPLLQTLARNLAEYNLRVAEDRLAKLAELERGH